MRMYTGDLEPDLRVIIGDADDPTDLTTATVRVLAIRGDEAVFDRPATSVDTEGETTVVTVAWQVGDTDVVGRIRIEIEATWPGGQPQTYRPDGGVDVLRDFDLVP